MADADTIACTVGPDAQPSSVLIEYTVTDSLGGIATGRRTFGLSGI